MRVGMGELAWTFFRIGLTSWGGPAIVSQIRDVTVKKKAWLTDSEFEETLAFCQMLPGPIAVQTAAHIGWRMRGNAGCFLALGVYILPASSLMFLLSALYFHLGRVPAVATALKGLGPIVTAIVIDSILSMRRMAVRNLREVVIAVACLGGFFVHAHPLLVLLGAGLAGIVLFKRDGTLAPNLAPSPASGAGSDPPSGRRTISLVLSLAIAYALLVIASGRLLPVLPLLGSVMTRINLLAFGGGYTAIALMLYETASPAGHAWLSTKEFVDGLALGQITPGPVITTATFIGYKVAGVVGSLFATFCIFFPSSLLLVLLAPHLRRIRRLWFATCVIRGLLAAFIGMLLYVLYQVASASLAGVIAIVAAAVALVLLRRGVSPIWLILASVPLSWTL